MAGPARGVDRPQRGRAGGGDGAVAGEAAGGPINWEQLFGRKAPVALDLGCGNGRFLIGSAVARPCFDHLGVDTLPVVIRYARRRGNQRGRTNLRCAVGGARELLADHVEPGSVAEVHCYHPQPYYDPAHVHRRLLTPAFLALVRRTLTPGGLFVVQTDNPGYWRYLRSVLPVFFDFTEQHGPWPAAPRGRRPASLKATPEQQRATAELHAFFRHATRRLADAALADVKTLHDWQRLRPQLRRQLLEMLGLDPLPEKTDLHGTVTGTVDAG